MISDDPVGHNPSVALMPKNAGAFTFVQKTPMAEFVLAWAAGG